MKVFHPHARRRRAHGAFIVIALFMGTLLAAFLRMQVLGSSTWTLKAESNRLRPLPVPAPRGTIYDRNGEIMADNVPGYAITLLPGPPDSIRSTLERMSRYMDLPEARIDRLLAELRRYGREVVVDAAADFDVVSALEERRTEFPDVYIEMRPRRRYLAGPAAAHVLGYVGEITADELDSDAFPPDRYEQGMVVGKTGIEREYEPRLQGQQGLRYVEVDARGRIVGDFAGVTAAPAEPGQDLHLNLDMDLQEYIHHIFPDTMAGAVVALDPADGGVLALYSAPTFDPNDFVGHLDPDLWERLNTDEQTPMYDRAVLGLYPPASTWKVAAAAIALDLGVVGPDDTMPEACDGSFYYGGRTWHCWDREGHGAVDLIGAIANSCDVYFYQLGLRIGLDRLLQRATDIGFSRRCGIDLPQESQGMFPATREYWRRVWNYDPREGEVLNLAIGQGPNSQTPLKMAQFYLALARDGSAPPPAIAQGVDLGPGWHLNLSQESLAALREGLREVTQPGGTAHYAGTLEHFEVLGKTGTGQNALSVQGLAGDHAWFAALVGPFGGDPEIVVVALVEYGEHGSSVAAPIAVKAADYYLRKKHGIPEDTIQTLGEWIRTRGWPKWYRDRYSGGNGG
ncbi:MAG: penicillin-binding protein 2 [Gemmatimonadota bacterium]